MKIQTLTENLHRSIYQNVSLVSAFLVLVFGLVVFSPAMAGAAEPRSTDCNTNPQLSLTDGTKCADPGTTAENLTGENGVFQTVANILLFLVGAVAVIMLIVGGLRYVTSNGEQNAVSGAKNTILYAIIGIVVAFLAYAGVNFVVSQLSAGTGV